MGLDGWSFAGLRGDAMPWRAAPGWSRVAMMGICAIMMLLGLVVQVQAQQAPPINGIYTCTDANGRKLRSDRPIPACLDREQTVLNPSGTVRAKVGPSLSPQQRAELEERKKEDAAERARELEEKRRDRAMLARYPTREAHDKERADAHARLDTVVVEAEKRIVALHEERKKIDRELEFYQGDPAKAPAALRRQIDYVTQGLQAQRRFIQAQENERQRVDARFEEELARLKELWQEPKRGGNATPRVENRP
jgi:DNA repair exonuclease SbcCD ATPase subunit